MLLSCKNKNHGILTFGTTWMELEVSMLGYISQTEGYHMFALVCEGKCVGSVRKCGCCITYSIIINVVFTELYELCINIPFFSQDY